MKSLKKEELENFLDSVGIVDFFTMLTEICEDKSHHMRMNYRDKKSWVIATEWQKLGVRISKVNINKLAGR